MTDNASDSRPLDLSDLREADTLGQAWDAWLRDDIEPTRHEASQKLAAGIAATVEELYDWDDAPKAPTSFRTGLKRDLLHMHDALRVSGAAAAPDSWEDPPTAGSQGAAQVPAHLPVTEKPAKAKRFRALRSWLPAVEVAAACVLIAALLGVAFANDRIAEFFRDEESGNFASQGGSGEPSSQSFQSTPVTIEQGWINVIRDDAGVGLRPDRMTVAEGYVAVVSEHYESESVALTVFNESSGERLWTANVNTGVYVGIQGRNSAPIIVDGRLYFLNRAGFLYGFDIESYPDDLNALIVSVQFPFAATNGDLMVHDGVLYAAGGKTDEADWILPSMVQFGDALFIAGDLDDSVIGFDLGSNTFVEQAVGLPLERSAQLDDGFGDNGLWQMDLASGTVTHAWQEPGVEIQYVNVLDNGLLAVSLSSVDGEYLGISFRDAADIDIEVFRFMPAGELWDSRVFPVASIAVVMTSTPKTSTAMVAIDPNNPDAAVELPWDYTNAPSKPDPIIGGITYIVVSDDDILRVYDPVTGAVLGQTPLGTQNGEVTTLSVVDDVVYTAFEDGTIVEFLMIPTDRPVPSPALNAIPTATLVPAQT